MREKKKFKKKNLKMTKRFSQISVLLMLMLVISVSCFAQKPVIAVYVVSEASDDNEMTAIKKVLESKLVEAFDNSNLFTATERSEAFRSQLTKEKVYQLSGNVQDDQITRLGRESGAKYVCIAEIVDVFNEKFVNTRLIETESNNISGTANSSGSIKSMKDLVSIASEVSNKLVKATPQGKELQRKEEQKQEEARRKAEQVLAEQRQQQEQILAEQRRQKEEEERRLYVTLPYDRLMVRKTDEADYVNWATANAACKQSRADGFSDWRLPTRYELLQIFDQEKKFAKLGGAVGYWSSDIAAAAPPKQGSSHWAVKFFFYGPDPSRNHTDMEMVPDTYGRDCRCVRDY